MKKNILTKYLPFVAAVLLATSCGKDDNGGSIVEQPSSTEEVVQPDPNPEAPKTVTIPFSVKVNDGASLSKIQYEANGNVVSRTFESDDCGNITLDLRSTPGVASTSDPLELSQDGEGGYVFSGSVTVESGYADAFNDGEMQLTGMFKYTGKVGNEGYSTTSLVDLEENHCDHIYKAEFLSCDEEITLVDQNAYLCFTVNDKQTKFDLTFNGEATALTFTPDATSHKIWIAVPCGGNNNLPTVKGTMVSVNDTDLKPGTVYKVNRTDVVDLGPGFSVLWTTCNLGATSPSEIGLYYAWGETTGYAAGSGHDFSSPASYQDHVLMLPPDHDPAYKKGGYRMPTSDELKLLYQLPGASYKAANAEENTYHVAGLFYKNDYGEIFFPASGYFVGTTLMYTDLGRYWSSTPNYIDDSPKVEYLIFNIWTKVDVYGYPERHEGSLIRAVRCMNSFDGESYDNAMFESEKGIKI